MLIELLEQIVGVLILLSLALTLILYVRFKRHQKKRQDSLSLVSGYGMAIVTIVFVFGTYFDSLGIRVRDSAPPPLETEQLETQIKTNEIIDMRPTVVCQDGEGGEWGICSDLPFRILSVVEPEVRRMNPGADMKLETM